MIAQVRSFIRSCILKVDSDLVENQSAFYDGEIGENLIDRSYQITINSSAKTQKGEFQERTLSCEVSIFGFGYREEIQNFDALMDKAICIEDNILNLKEIASTSFVVNAESNGITANRIESNDDGFKIDLTFTLTLAYSLEE